MPCDRSLANHMRKYLKFLTAIVITYNASNQADEPTTSNMMEKGSGCVKEIDSEWESEKEWIER